LPGEHRGKESTAEYDRICNVLRSNAGRLPETKNGALDLTIAELVLRYMEDHASSCYRDPATREPTTELGCLKFAFKPLNRLFGQLPMVEFDSLKLETLQQAMATGSWLTEKERRKRQKTGQRLTMARTTINRHVERIKRLFRWGCAKKLVPADLRVNLEAVASLKQGRSAARETDVVAPVEVHVVEKTLPHMTPVVADTVRLLL
jgi:hypothetical protein